LTLGQPLPVEDARPGLESHRNGHFGIEMAVVTKAKVKGKPSLGDSMPTDFEIRERSSGDKLSGKKLRSRGLCP